MQGTCPCLKWEASDQRRTWGSLNIKIKFCGPQKVLNLFENYLISN